MSQQPPSSPSQPAETLSKTLGRQALLLGMVFLGAAVAAGVVAWVLVVMFARKQEERQPYLRVVQVTEVTTDPEPWGKIGPISSTAGSPRQATRSTAAAAPCRRAS